jgi:phosphoribosyl 1,2-cyclic phosphate phosphodiesterase
MEFIILGTSAGGIPQSDCMQCKACRSAIENKGKDVRTRQSIIINNDGYTLIDADPDLRFQLIREKINLREIKEVFLTHIHGDHIFGLCEFAVGNVVAIPIFSDKIILDNVFDKSFDFMVKYGWAKPTQLKGEIKIRKLKFIPFEVPHTPKEFGPTLSYKIIENEKILTYVPDIATFTPEILKIIDNSNVIIIDGVFYDKSRVGHISIKDSIPFLQKLNLGQVIFTQMNHSEPTHEELEEKLKPYEYKFKVAYDGMKIKM